MKGKHHHRCQDCDTKTECFGQVEQNYDGSPEWICRDFHAGIGLGQIPYIDPDFVCDACAEKRDADLSDRAPHQTTETV